MESQNILSPENNHRITYLYDANGTKLRKCYYEDNHLMETTDYYGSFVYRDENPDHILMPEVAPPPCGGGWEGADHLGNIRSVITTDTNQHWLAQGTDYYPFGMEIPVYGNSDNQLKYNGKELQTEAGLEWYDYGARFYDPVLGRWHSVDPMADERSWVSPYNFCQNNPLIRVDPIGALDNPIYDWGGNFLGTDDKGLQGEAIIMNKSDFTQGMSHDNAMSAGFTLDNMSIDNALNFANNGNFNNFLDHYNSLSSRPDYNGIVTREDGISWAKLNPGALDNPTPDNMLYIDASKLDFGNISTSDFQNINESTPINLLNAGNFVASAFNKTLESSVYALGRVNMVLQSRESRSVSIVNDYNLKSDRATDYDWNKGGGIARSTLINAERKLNGLKESHGFRTYYYGNGILNK
ncbi:MAG: RHS repeat-associated core domain-containing protein [Bacteroidales bacterium]|nr:RHS repeat-associated core domain-containing protein [Bacteroidales bacterium]